MASTSTSITRRCFIRTTGIGAAALTLPCCSRSVRRPERPPNIVILFTDDQGYSDVGMFGARGFETPNLDRMAAEGIRFTDFYVSQPVCSASRASLLTGCYANRIGIHGALDHTARHGIHEREMTIAELVKQKDYSTAIFGKWHLGHHPEFLPTRHGFDEYFGLPYSNDMWPHHPTTRDYYPPLPLIEGEEVIKTNPDQSMLTTWCTERAVDFINRNRESPFFLYMPYSMPHVPLFVSDKFRGKSEQGLYGDVIMEIDWSVGEILAALNENGLDENTLVIFTSDNGPWLSYGKHAGSARSLREGKGTVWEGGVREPCIMRWPEKIPEGAVCAEPVMTIDILPTLAGLITAQLPSLAIDGLDIWPLMSGKRGAVSPHEALYFYYGRNELQALRSGKWKLVFPHRYRSLTGEPGKDGQPGGYTYPHSGLELYDLENDVGENHDIAGSCPEVVERLQRLAEIAREDMGDALTGREGRNIREAGRRE